MKLLIYIFLLYLAITGCKESEPSIEQSIRFEAVIPLFYGSYENNGAQNGIEVKIYDSEENYLNDTNPILTGITRNDENSFIELPLDKDRPELWVRASNDELNHLRYADIKPDYTSFFGNNYQKTFLHSVRLSTTPVQLEIELLSLSETNGMSVQLYLSEEDYNQKTLPYHSETLSTTFIGAIQSGNPLYWEPLVSGIFQKTVETGSTVVFKDLEPKIYWFSVLDKDQNHVLTDKFKLDEPLPNTPDLVTKISISIQ